ncbi:anthranilate phosphoribosyltransferase [Microbacteriaceae bacterium SG_E_30_P1]|uniref:Anthranilate phosphoribosyltransferase n=1 Tax=Antiquaquibacter oligotrophicus TaxID=2880260 RepID=A0ABT6KLF3_9MICO|nr:anthranilate phosphoribosyltransferase [Antiquaquibacter oligotrophicus]MDH6180843.1 anthranilate phosphoribosyltransferase [Antiquaquibacter oligotrophicus]UDF13442.1 anthranilate phosphoribosyltransferase [Antiquaquibacter oligotrophicus]
MANQRTWPAILSGLVEGRDLSIGEAEWAMQSVMAGEATSAQIAALLVALRIKGETVDEIVGFRDAVLAHAEELAVPADVLDIVGTGGDPYGAVLNISSIASVIASAAGVPVVKHGNRAASSSSGASDVLSALGLDLDISAERAAAVFREVGITFAFAALFHPGFRHAGPTRKELGIPTLFNILGPLCNPARPNASAVGVSSLERVPLMVGVFQTRGATALVYRGDDGIDKLTTTGHSHIWEVSRGFVAEHDLDPSELGIPRASIESLLGGSPEDNAATAREMLAGAAGPVRDVVLLNAAAGLVSWELSRDPELIQVPIVDRLATQMERAASVVDSGAALAKLDEWVAATRRTA